MDTEIRVRTLCTQNINGLRWFEVHLQMPDGIYRIVDVTVGEAKRLGICTTLNGSRKIREWIVTEEAQRYLTEREVAKQNRLASQSLLQGNNVKFSAGVLK